MFANQSKSRFVRSGFVLAFVAALAVLGAGSLARAGLASTHVFFFSTGEPDGRMATASRPGSPSLQEIEAADDFLLTQETLIRQATFTGLLPAGTVADDVTEVVVEIYRVFPNDSANPPDLRVPTRNNSPSDNALDSRDSDASDVTGKLAFELELLDNNFTAENSVLDGIHPLPQVATLGEGPVFGEEVRFEVAFPRPFDLAAGHYFFIPQVKLASGEFFWLSAPKPILAPGTPFLPDLQSWIRNEALAPDWLRVGADIVGGATPPAFNASFSLHGSVVHRN